MNRIKTLKVIILLILINFSINLFCINDKKNTQVVKSEIFCNNFSIYTTKSFKCEEYNPNINFKFGKNIFQLKNYKANHLSRIQSEIIESGYVSRVKALCFAFNNGFSKEESLIYAFPETECLINDIQTRYCYEAKNATLKAKKDSGQIYVEKEKNGLMLDREALINELFNGLSGFCNNITINLQFLETESDRNLSYFKNKSELRGSYATYFSGSSESRKNNIKRALDSLDGYVIEPNEVLSFNNVTGERTESNGYMKAKTIKNGSFYEEFGGGVCQVSTTLYNAALLSNLEIIEVNPHSLPVSYIEPCFDAMVNSGSSDLIIKNNTNSPVIIACSSKNDTCLVNVYGVRNEYNIKRVSKKTEEIDNYEKEVINDYKIVGLDKPIGKGKTKVISYGKKGYKAVGCLEYYKNDVLVKTKNIRYNIYNPTKEVILVG